MKIGIDYRPALLKRTGIGRYVRELVRAIGKLDNVPQLALYAHSWKSAQVPITELGLTNPKFQLHRRKLPSRVIAMAQNWFHLGLESFVGQVDLFHYTDYVYPRLNRTSFVSTLHDAAFLEAGFFSQETAEALHERSLWAIEQSRLIVAPSAFTAGELVLRLGAKPGRVVVIPHGVDHIQASTPARKEAEPYFLTVGTLEPRKNHIRILEAFELLVQKGFPHRWIIVGQRGWMFEEFLRKLENSPVRERVQVRELHKEQELASLYSGADCTVYASLYEGFGFPTLEAMQCGCPVVTSAISSMPEICGNAAIYVDPRHSESIAEGLETILKDKDLQQSLREKGRQRASLFTWEIAAKKTLSAYNAALKNREGSLSKLF